MNRAFTLTLLALTLAGAANAAEQPQAQAKPAPAILEGAPKGTVAFDDDGGRAQMIPRQAVPGREATYHGGPVVSHATVQAVFLGSGWRDRANRAKESVAAESLKQGAGAETAALLGQHGVRAWEPAGLALEDPAGDPLNGNRISDLEIQIRLDNMLGQGQVDKDAVYVVFLAPDLQSSLGSRLSERDFAAYHNHVHSAGGVIHYVVVPYDSEPSHWLAAARQSLTQALINPEGNGWY
ncbi:MAG TPA: hypothetical protein VH988_10665 [Thermoanaerobaculia bacterium]|nr:hypothetical protein [Thermoanaerobaculia bacterium]